MANHRVFVFHVRLSPHHIGGGFLLLNTIYILPIFCKEYYTFTTHHSILPFITIIDFNQNSRHIFVETKTKKI